MSAISVDDRALVERALAPRRPGQDRAAAHAAFRELYDRHKDGLYAFLLRFLRDEALAEDALQEAFLRVHRNLDAFDASRSFRAWLYEIGRNAGLDASRRRAKQDRLAAVKASEAAPASDAVLDEVERREARDRAASVLDRLPDDARALLIQRHGHGMKLSELAESFACTERTVRNRLRSAAVLLARAVLGGSGEGSRS